MRERACAQVRRGELSRARQTLTGAPLAPSNADALRLLSDPDKHPPHPRHPIPDDVVRFCAANPLCLKAAELGEALRTAKRGSAAGLSGSVEHYRLLLEDEEALDLLAHAASLLTNADALADVLRALALSRLTALSKPGGVRGIATGDTLRRLVSRTLARRYAETFDRATRPFQFALQARAGTDCLAAMLRAASELDADATNVSLDGRSAYDTVSRAAFLTKLREVAPDLVPFVREWYGGTPTYPWRDSDGRCHEISQGDGCEQGDALAPALYSLAQHDALAMEGEYLAAVLDDLYLVTTLAHRQTSQNAHAPLTRPQHPPPTARGAALAQAGAGAVAAARQPLPLHLTPPAGESYPIILGIAGRCRAAGRVRRTAPDDARCPTLSGCPCAPRIGACTEGIALAEPSGGHHCRGGMETVPARATPLADTNARDGSGWPQSLAATPPSFRGWQLVRAPRRCHAIHSPTAAITWQ